MMLATNPKDIIGQSKPQLHLIPAAAEIAESRVMALGARKYGPFNWRTNRVLASVYVSAARRHLAAWFDGEDLDPESGESHLAHARACLGIMLDAIAVGNIGDDRPPAGAASRLLSPPNAGDGDDAGGSDDIDTQHVPVPVSSVDIGG